MLKIRDLHVTLNEKRVLSGVDLDLQEGESLIILGCSGTGKSVLLKTILGLLPKDSGTISVDGVDLDKATPEEETKVRHRMGMLFQGSALFDSLTLWENVAFGLIYGRKMPPEEAKPLALAAMEKVELDRKMASLMPASLSGGMQKRVGLARTLILEPRMIFFDEPTTGLDPITSGIVNDLIVQAVKGLNIGSITITHDLNSVHKIADRICFLFEGKIIWTGSLKGLDTTENPYMRQFLDAKPSGPLTENRP
ncbi:ABC transporter ATP-binding protein [Alphaproteobacteria bacterium]|nr:ABC transporter ATP-binding protein [Alphaproteobacteria bacterium]GHS96752.1 ABC transporter ATP-binding protein [Alphaproteobacteria bacterium]